MQNDAQNTICRLCLIPCECSFEDVEADTEEMLRTLDLELVNLKYLSISGNPAICKTCLKNMQKCFDFKTVCLCSEDCINSFKNDSNDIKLDLREIYLRKNKIEDIVVSKCHTVCRLCMEIAEPDCWISLNEETKDVISARTVLEICFSGLDLKITKNPVICTSCQDSLHSYFNFMKKCLDMKNYEINYNGIDIYKSCNENGLYDEIKLKTENLMEKLSQELYIKREVNEDGVDEVVVEELSDMDANCHEKEQNSETQLKCENLETEHSGFRIKHEEIDIKIEEGDTARFQANVPLLEDSSAVNLYQCKNCKHYLTLHEDISEIVLHQCEECSYKTESKCCLETHKLTDRKDSKAKMHDDDSVEPQTTHGNTLKNTSEIKMYSCGTCTYKTKRKGSLKRHMLIHKNTYEVTTYSCEICTYKANHKSSLQRHMLVHKNSSEITFYPCGICTYKTKYKNSLNQHMLIHKSPSEVTVYSCEICTYETKRKGCLRRHILIHKNAAEITMYSCKICPYKAKQKGHLKWHMLIHKNASEVTMYSCGMCSYKTKRKCTLKRHMLIHKNADEVTTHSCGICTYITRHKSSLKRHVLTHRIPS